MAAAIILVFVVGYIAITVEHPLKLDKTVPALMMAAVMWALLALGFRGGIVDVIDGHGEVFHFGAEHAAEGFKGALLHHLGKTAEILVFLIGAMTIVELIDLHRGFSIIKGWVKTHKKKSLLWIIAILAFILSAIIDNLTATLVLITILRKLVVNKKERLWFAGIVVIAANAGGSWSPIGDVTTTMLWIENNVSTAGLMEKLVIPAVVCLVVPTFIASLLPAFKGDVTIDDNDYDEESQRLLSSRTMLALGLTAIVSVPVFKTFTHLPPYMGMMLALSVVWLVSEYIHPEEDFDTEKKEFYSPLKALSRIEMSSILFFLGILLAVGALETLVIDSVGTLRYAADALDHSVPNRDIVILILGAASAVIDNVPLVAASMGMYDFPLDDHIWHFIAYAAGTGGSMLIIGSAAGVAAMGLERIDFIWYLKKISWLAILGYLAGAGVFILME